MYNARQWILWLGDGDSDQRQVTGAPIITHPELIATFLLICRLSSPLGQAFQAIAVQDNCQGQYRSPGKYLKYLRSNGCQIGKHCRSDCDTSLVLISINQSINQTSIAPISQAESGSVARQPNQCSTAKLRKLFRNRPCRPLNIMDFETLASSHYS